MKYTHIKIGALTIVLLLMFTARGWAHDLPANHSCPTPQTFSTFKNLKIPVEPLAIEWTTQPPEIKLTNFKVNIWQRVLEDRTWPTLIVLGDHPLKEPKIVSKD